jgi:hypothetical protein
MPETTAKPVPRKTARAKHAMTIDLLDPAIRAKLEDIRRHHGLSAAGMIRTLISREFDEIRRIPERQGRQDR